LESDLVEHIRHSTEAEMQFSQLSIPLRQKWRTARRATLLEEPKTVYGKTLRTILALKCKNGLDLLGISLLKKYAILSAAKWCGNDSALSISCHKNDKRNYFLRVTRTQRKISSIQKVSLLYGSRKNFFDFNIISLIETSFF